MIYAAYIYGCFGICGYVCASLLWSVFWFLAGGVVTYGYLWATHQLKGQT